jgi:hypothetical protein
VLLRLRFGLGSGILVSGLRPARGLWDCVRGRLRGGEILLRGSHGQTDQLPGRHRQPDLSGVVTRVGADLDHATSDPDPVRCGVPVGTRDHDPVNLAVLVGEVVDEIRELDSEVT